jgi:hypothetical protein
MKMQVSQLEHQVRATSLEGVNIKQEPDLTQQPMCDQQHVQQQNNQLQHHLHQLQHDQQQSIPMMTEVKNESPDSEQSCHIVSQQNHISVVDLTHDSLMTHKIAADSGCWTNWSQAGLM